MMQKQQIRTDVADISETDFREKYRNALDALLRTAILTGQNPFRRSTSNSMQNTICQPMKLHSSNPQSNRWSFIELQERTADFLVFTQENNGNTIEAFNSDTAGRIL